MHATTISVIIPAYNVSKYIEAALASLAAQTVLPDEVIIIDDGSTDNTLELIRRFHHPYPAEILSTKNQGQGRARNLGLSLATCEYVYFFDSDDLLSTRFIEKVKELVNNNAVPDIIFFSGRYFHDGVDEASFKPEYKRGFSGYFNSLLDLLTAFERSGCFSSSPCLYISKRDIWTASSLEFIDYYHEDQCILYPLVFSANSYVVTDEVFFDRRIRESSTMTQDRNEKHVMGMHSTVSELLILSRSVSDAQLGKFVYRRAYKYLKKYIVLSKMTGIALDKKMLASAMLTLKHPKVLACVFYFSIDGRVRRRIKRLFSLGSGRTA